MITTIFTSKKLEKITKSLIEDYNEKLPEISKLGKWNATVFYVYRKKCWLVTNSRTRYSVILANVKSSDLSQINRLFKEALHRQMNYDSVSITPEEIDILIGDLRFNPTDNDRRTIGFQNSHLSTLEYRKDQYGMLENWPITQIVHFLNNTYFYWNKPKMTEGTYPVTELRKELETLETDLNTL
ncbi:hypothetical protein FHG64_15445 [Antarcticibacterium flavum]|uniref:DUF6933 domain-containing protein n=1 Tax=Antarcticibacterium flavum TaxID=2058175 RepID=A0A5B7X7Q8_9FLAO|nr:MULTISPECIES: hypothetical protein [Antarcticibacterium]MCM4159740.1 hypothetical protein [Antarcticibacterium sp. W02-3]QCY70673.1 hypothetical protein FHG64_15445 [Antarcticibacterium flavum]